MAVQTGVPHVLTGPGGDRAVFNDPFDPDFIGYLDPEQGLTRAVETRTNQDTITEDDGGRHGPSFRGLMSVGIAGFVWPDPVVAANARMDKLDAASDAYDEDATLRWTEAGSVEKILWLRRVAGPTYTGRYPKKFTLGMSSAIPYVLSSSEQSIVIPALGTANVGGRSYPRSYPLDYGSGSGAGVGTAVNLGNVRRGARPRFRIDGPITNPILANDTTGHELRIIYQLLAGEYLIVDNGEILLGDEQTDRYSALDFERSTWWRLRPGNNIVRLRASAYAAPAALTVWWRHTFNN